MNDWGDYYGDRLKKDHPAGFVIIIPKVRESPIPIACPVCDMLMQSADDAEYFRTKSCCQKCGMKWADPNKEVWVSGWRPNQQEVNDEVSLRQSMPISINIDLLEG